MLACTASRENFANALRRTTLNLLRNRTSAPCSHFHKRNVELLTAPWPAADSRQHQILSWAPRGTVVVWFTTMGVWVHIVATNGARGHELSNCMELDRVEEGPATSYLKRSEL
jgi:hypothetical protein